MKHVVVGASGRVGSGVVRRLLARGDVVRAIVHSEDNAQSLAELGAEVVVADVFERDEIVRAFAGIDTALVMTPESPTTHAPLGDAERMVRNFRDAVDKNGVRSVFGLSSIGAQLGRGTGTLEASFELERGFDGSRARCSFVRPSYYYSNWLMSADEARDAGTLTSFLPVGLALTMASPDDVAGTIAALMVADPDPGVHEVVGATYTARDVAAALGRVFRTRVVACEVPRDERVERLEKVGFSHEAAIAFSKMTDVVAAGRAVPVRNGTTVHPAPTSLDAYLRASLRGPTWASRKADSETSAGPSSRAPLSGPSP